MNSAPAILPARSRVLPHQEDEEPVSSAAVPMVVAEEARAPYGFRLSDAVITFFLRWRLLLLAFLLPILLGVAASALLTTRYTADASIVVLTSRDWAGAPDISGFGPTVVSVEMLKVVRSEVEIIQSREVARRVIARLGIGTLFPDLAGDDGSVSAADQMNRATELFQRALKVVNDVTSNVVRIQFTHPDRQVAVAAMSALLESYYENRGSVFTDQNASVLNAELTRYTDQLRGLESQIQAVKTRYNVLDIGQEIQLTSQRIDGIAQREEKLQEQGAATLAQLSAAQSQLSAQPNRVFSSAESTNLTPNDDSRNTLSRLMLEREHMATQYTADYPGLRELDRRIATARAATREAQRSNFQTTREVRNPVVELLAGRVATLQVEASATQRQLAELARQRGESEIRAANLREADSQLRDLTRQRDALETILRQFSTRQAGARVEEEARRDRAPNVQTLEAPSAPVNGRSGRLLVLLGGVALGGAAFCGLLLLLTLTRRIFATPQEAERGLGLPAVGSFGDLRAASEDLKERRDVADLAALLLDTRVAGRRPCVVQVLSGGPADERAELVRSLAIEVARRRSADTLIIDLQTDGRPHLAALGSRPLDVERIPGHVLTFSTAIPNLWVTFEAQDSHLTDPHVGRKQTAALIGQLRDAFDMVLVIGPDADRSYPMRRLTALVDLNVIVVRGERTRADQARQMRDWVLGSGGALLGFVFTGRRRIMPRRLEAALEPA